MPAYRKCTGARRHGQDGHLPPPPLETFKVICALVVTAKRPVYELFMHYFDNLLSVSGSFAEAHSLTPLDFRPHTLNLPTLENIPRARMRTFVTCAYQKDRCCLHPRLQ